MTAWSSAYRTMSASRLRVMLHQRVKAQRRTVVDKWRIVSGDKVQVLRGPEAGKQGIVERVIRARNSVLVKGVNTRKRFVSATPQSTGYAHMKESPIHISAVALVDPSMNKPTRIRVGYLEDGSRVRLSVLSGSIIPKPDGQAARTAAKRNVNAQTDTPASAAAASSYVKPDWAQVREWMRAQREQIEGTKREHADAIVQVQQRRAAKNDRLRAEGKSPREHSDKVVRLRPRWFEYVSARSVVGQYEHVLRAQTQLTNAPQGFQYFRKH